jgi:hypothetical protein
MIRSLNDTFLRVWMRLVQKRREEINVLLLKQNAVCKK